MNKIFGKIFSFIFVTIFAIISFSCSEGRHGETGSDYDVNINVDTNLTATLKVACMASTDEMNIISKLGEGFKSTYPNVTVVPEPMGGNKTSTIMGYYRSGTMPDIVQLSSFEMLNLGNAGVLLNLDPYISAEIENKTFLTSDYYEAFWKLGQKDFNGEQWMVPRAADQVVCHVNTKILAAAGVNLNPDTTLVKNGWSWDDFLTVCAQVKKKYPNKAVIDSYMDWEAVFNPIIKSFGGKYFDDNNNVAINNDGVKEALKLMKDLVDKGYQGVSSDMQANFAGGTGAFLFHSQSASISIKGLNIAYNGKVDKNYYDVVTFPIINNENPQIGAGVAGYSISSTSINRDIAWKFLKYMISKDGQNCIADCGTNYPPIRKDMADATNPENHWGLGYEQYNLSAYTWAAQNNYICFTDYILAKPGNSTDLLSAISTMISDYTDIGRSLENSVNKCANKLQYWLDN